jgi:iron complex outermembrane receptor protein
MKLEQSRTCPHRSLVAIAVSIALFMSNPRVTQAVGAAAAPTAPSSSTSDAADSAGALQEIVVTAEKRSSNLQDTPITVSAFDAAALKQVGVTDTSELGLITPGLEFGSEFGYGQPHLRGVGTLADGPGVENPVALYVDGVYYGPMAGSVLALSNIQDVEVLKGPQGTLFGRNATGGLIQVTTRDPKQNFAGESSTTYGKFNTWGEDLYLTGGVTGNTAADLAVHFLNQSTGYGTNAFTGLDVNKSQDLAVRSKWVIVPDDVTSIKIIADYSRDTTIPALVPAPGTTPLGGPPYTGPRQGLDGYYQPHGLVEGKGLSVHFERDLGFGQLVSTTAYRKTYMDMSFDGSLVEDYNYALNIEIWERHQQFTQELQLSSPDNSPIKWIGGLFFYDADGQYDPISIYGGLLQPLTYANTFSDQRAVSVAGYTQATKEIAAATNLTVGVRYTWERRRFHNYEIIGEPAESFDGGKEQVSYTKPTWRVALDHRFSPQLLAYVSYNRGFKSGGFNDDLVPTSVYQPETLDAYEAGAKLDLLDRRLRIDTAAFLYNYKNIQAVRYPNGLEVIFNGAAARLYGVDLDLNAKLAKNLTLNAGVEWLHARFTSFPNADYSTPAPGGGTNFDTFDATGQHLAMAPDATANVSLNYEIPTPSGDYDASASYSYNSGWYVDPDNRLHQAAYGLYNARFSWTAPSTLWKVAVWGKNLGNRQYTTALASQANGDYAVYAPPRTFGITVDWKF